MSLQPSLRYLPDKIMSSSILIWGGVGLLSVICLIQYMRSRAKRTAFPIIDPRDEKDYRCIIMDGVAKYPDTPFYILGSIKTLMLPKSYIDEIRSMPEDKMTLRKFVRQEFHVELTGIGDPSKPTVKVVNTDLTRHVATALPQIQEEIIYSFDHAFGSCEDWSSFPTYFTLGKIVAIISGRILVGLPLSRNEEWIDNNIAYAMSVVKLKAAFSKWPEWSWDIVRYFIKEVREHSKLCARASKNMKPLLDMKIDASGMDVDTNENTAEQGKFVTWLRSRLDAGRRNNREIFTEQQLALSFASIHVTTTLITQAMYDLAAYPEYVPILLEEIRSIMREDPSGTIQKSSLPKLTKLDSFIKESQRVSPFSLVSHIRDTASDIKLSTGQVIPKDTRISVPSWAIHHSSPSLHSPGYTKSLSEFDGLRFHNLRHVPGNENRYQFVTTSTDSLSFGHGMHSCPGRFFANNIIKLTIIHLLMDWEIRFPDDLKREGGAWRRPKNQFREFDYVLDMNADLEIRKRKI